MIENDNVLSQDHETFNIYIEDVPFSGKAEVSHYLTSMADLNMYVDSFVPSKPEWDYLLNKGDIRINNPNVTWSLVAQAFNDQVLNVAYKIHGSTTSKKIWICNGRVLVTSSILAPFLQDCGRLTKAEVKALQDQATRYLKEEICRVDLWVMLLADSETILKRIENSSALDSSPFSCQQLDNLRCRFEDYFHHGDYFEGKVWVKKNRPIFNTSYEGFFGLCASLLGKGIDEQSFRELGKNSSFDSGEDTTL